MTWRNMVLTCLLGIGGFLWWLPIEDPRDKEGRSQRVKNDISTLTAALRCYELRSLEMPTSEEGLRALTEKPTLEALPKRWRVYLPSALLDPWGHAYQYRNP